MRMDVASGSYPRSQAEQAIPFGRPTENGSRSTRTSIRNAITTSATKLKTSGSKGARFRQKSPSGSFSDIGLNGETENERMFSSSHHPVDQRSISRPAT